MSTLKGTAYFCKHLKPAPESRDSQGNVYVRRYELSLGLDKEGVKQARGMKLKVNAANDSIPTEWVKITSNCETDELVETRKPQVYFGKEPGYDGYIWNASKVNVIGEVKEYRGKPKFIWRAIQILELGPEPENYVEPVDIEAELVDVKPTKAKTPDPDDDLDDLP